MISKISSIHSKTFIALKNSPFSLLFIYLQIYLESKQLESKKVMKHYNWFRLSIGIFLFNFTMTNELAAQEKPKFLTEYNQEWVDKTFASLTLDEKIGQLLMPRGNFSGKDFEVEKLLMWIKEYKIGGLTMFAGPPTRQALVTNLLQANSRVPLLIGQDFEWGLAMRLDSTVKFPYAMTLGSIQGKDDVMYAMGEEVGRQCNRMGVHVNYAPVVDVNVNPKNPVINFRSYGENKYIVAKRSIQYLKGMQSQNIIATAKHFPGHGDTGVDSHYDLPLIPHDKARLNDIELYPYKELISQGLSGIMTAHLSIPALDNTKNLASTLSPKIVTDLLKKELKFEGLVFTDAMDMAGAVKYFPNGQAIVKAILAGNDILETFLDVPTAVKAIKEAVAKKEIPMALLDARVKKILQAKSWVGLDKYQPIEMENLIQDLNPSKSDWINHELAEGAITLIKNSNSILPISDLQQKIVIVSIESEQKSAFQNMADNYTNIIHYQIKPNEDSLKVIATIAKAQSEADLLVIAIHTSSNSPYKKYGISSATTQALNVINAGKKNSLVVFGNPYLLESLPNIENFESIVVGHQSTSYLESAAAQAIFGAIPLSGKLPVSINEKYKVDHGINTSSIGRLAYGVPEQVGVDSRLLEVRIDSVVNVGLLAKAYPGAVLQIAKNGRVIYQKPYGFRTYEDGDVLANQGGKTYEQGNKDVMDTGLSGIVERNGTRKAVTSLNANQVKLSTIYDFASVTKVTTSALAVMQMMSNGQFDLDKTFGDYYPAFKGTNKADLKFRDMLTHRSGLKAWIPFWTNCIDSVATIKFALENNSITKEDLVIDTLKRSFWQKIFFRKAKTAINYLASTKRVKTWEKALTSNNIQWLPNTVSYTKLPDYDIQISENVWLNNAYKERIFNDIASSVVKPEQGYVYSDLHYYTYPTFVPNIVGTDWESYLKKTYKSLGANTLTYNPLRYYDKTMIAPTEYDSLFRRTVIHGRVHDEGASMLGGISGHAGLFGNANDLTKLMQMYLQNGSYGGNQFIKPEVLQECTSYQFPNEGNRRAIAFDKLDFNKTIGNGPQMASSDSYGHSGYTGTFTWVDPATETVYVFLANRVYPTRNNNKIGSLNIRTEVGNQLYKTIKESKVKM